ncbi:MAG: type II toxin-antitoxin system VapC family toxin [Gemmatimonadetes bacterium]|nr:type II toxin-antitoxin system VapC family toxin [Gemmatimonadota bacterium]
MIVDSSALLAIVFKEPGWADLLESIRSADLVAAGAPTLTETGIVLEARLGEGSRGLLERLLDELGVEELSFESVHWREALAAFRRFGKGRHAAALNFGDCLTYAVSRLTAEPLLCVGDDFPKTDLTMVGEA